MISGLVLKYRKDTGIDIAEQLSPASTSGKFIMTEPKKSLHGLKEVNKLACRALVTGHSN
jgi:hypothetical protein